MRDLGRQLRREQHDRHLPDAIARRALVRKMQGAARDERHERDRGHDARAVHDQPTQRQAATAPCSFRGFGPRGRRGRGGGHQRPGITSTGRLARWLTRTDTLPSRPPAAP